MTTTSLFKGTYTNEIISILEALEEQLFDVDVLKSFMGFAEQFNDEEFNNYSKKQYDITVAYYDDKIERDEAFELFSDLYGSDEQYIRLLGKTALYTKLFAESLPDEDEDEQ